MFIDFGEREGERERERERDNINVRKKHCQLPPLYSPGGDQTHNPGMRPDRGWNLQPFGAQDDAPTN